jgi:hypothetical protein
VQPRRSKSHVDEWIGTNDEHNDLGEASNVVVDKTAPVDIVEVRVLVAIALAHQEGLEEVVAHEEEDDEYDGEDESGEGRQRRNGFVDQIHHMRMVVVGVKMVDRFGDHDVQTKRVVLSLKIVCCPRCCAVLWEQTVCTEKSVPGTAAR